MIATATSSKPIRTSDRLPCRLPSRTPVSEASMALASFRLGLRERALAVMALASSGSMSLRWAIPATRFLFPLAPLRRDHHRYLKTLRARRTMAGRMRVPISRDVSPAGGQRRSGWRRASAGW